VDGCLTGNRTERTDQTAEFAADTERFVEIDRVILEGNRVHRANLFTGRIVTVSAHDRRGFGVRFNQR
jgi:hypothetical protein